MDLKRINVTAKFTDQGQIIPLRIDMPGQIIKIDSTGRNWNDDLGFHILAMDESQKVYHLLFSHQESLWYLIPIAKLNDHPSV